MAGGLVLGVDFWQGTNDGDATLFGRAQGDGRPDHARAMMHDAQAHAFAVQAGLGKANAIVGDLQDEAGFFFRQAQENGLGLAVLDGVGGGFLGDAVEMDGDGVVGDFDIGIALAVGR